MKLKDLITEGGNTIGDAHLGHMEAMLKRGFENEARWAMAEALGGKGKVYGQAYRNLEKIDQKVFGKKGGSYQTSETRLEIDLLVWKLLRAHYDTDSFIKINNLFSRMSQYNTGR